MGNWIHAAGDQADTICESKDTEPHSMTERPEPHWATEKDAWGRPIGRYSFRRRRGWACHHCGGLFRGLDSLLRHQERVLAAAPDGEERDSGERK